LKDSVGKQEDRLNEEKRARKDKNRRLHDGIK
jgi:hypothetical protein